MLIVISTLVWMGFRAVFRWMDVRDELRVWGFPAQENQLAFAEPDRRDFEGIFR